MWSSENGNWKWCKITEKQIQTRTYSHTKLRTKFLRTTLNLLHRVVKAYMKLHLTIFHSFFYDLEGGRGMRNCQHITFVVSTLSQSSCVKVHKPAPCKFCNELQLDFNTDIFVTIMPVCSKCISWWDKFDSVNLSSIHLPVLQPSLLWWKLSKHTKIFKIKQIFIITISFLYKKNHIPDFN